VDKVRRAVDKVRRADNGPAADGFLAQANGQRQLSFLAEDNGSAETKVWAVGSVQAAYSALPRRNAPPALLAVWAMVAAQASSALGVRRAAQCSKAGSIVAAVAESSAPAAAVVADSRAAVAVAVAAAAVAVAAAVVAGGDEGG
jgi:hypothetical protein